MDDPRRKRKARTHWLQVGLRIMGIGDWRMLVRGGEIGGNLWRKPGPWRPLQIHNVYEWLIRKNESYKKIW